MEINRYANLGDFSFGGVDFLVSGDIILRWKREFGGI